jgi:TonB family protein
VRRELAFVFVAFSAAALVAAQQTPPPAPSPATNPEPAEPAVNYAGPGVTAPELLPFALSTSSSRRCKELDGVVWLSAIMGANGVPREIHLLRTEGDNLGDFAIGLIAAARFKPGAYNGIPAAVAVEITADLDACAKHARNSGHAGSDELSFLTVPSITVATLDQPHGEKNPGPGNGAAPGSNGGAGVYRAGGHIRAPVLVYSVPATYSGNARRSRISGSCLVSAIIDVKGIPQNVHIVKSLDLSLDQNAVAAIKQYRFKPAMKDGTIPVPVMVTIEVDFRLY